MASIRKIETTGRWQVRYRDDTGRQRAKNFTRKIDAQRWATATESALHTGVYVDQAAEKITVAEWAEKWLSTYRPATTTTRQTVQVQIARITDRIGSRRLRDLRPSDVQALVARMVDEGYAPNTVKITRDRLGSLCAAALDDGILARNPVTRATAVTPGGQRPYVATTDQVWGVYEAMPSHLRVAILLGAFAGLRVAEAAGLRVQDVDLAGGVIHPTVQYPERPLKTEASRWPVPIPPTLIEYLDAAIREGEGTHVIPGLLGRGTSANTITNSVAGIRGEVEGLPDRFRFHDLRHYYASSLIAAGLDVKVIQTRLRHRSATTTLNVYGHLMPDSHQASLDAVEALMRPRVD